MEKSHGDSEKRVRRAGAMSRLCLTLALAARLLSGLNSEQMAEYHVKAAFLYNFARFVEWPAEAFRSPGDPFSICVLGGDPFGQDLDDVVAGKTIAGRPVAIRRFTDAREAGGCHILFINSSAARRVFPILSAATQPGLLTVVDRACAGAIINFTLEGSRVRFEIDTVAGEAVKLRFSSRLLSLATVVRK
jgi:hypothetical protein